MISLRKFKKKKKKKSYKCEVSKSNSFKVSIANLKF